MFGFSNFGEADHSAVDVSLINLIATPEKYHGKVVRVLGVLNLEFEGNHIWLSKEHWRNRVVKNSIWVSLNEAALGTTEKELSVFNGQYVIVEGVFNKDNHGHMGLSSGAIENITRLAEWRLPTN